MSKDLPSFCVPTRHSAELPIVIPKSARNDESHPFLHSLGILLGGPISPHPQRIGNPIDVVEPRRNQRNLQNCLIVEACGPQCFVIALPDFGGIFGELDDVVEHHAFLWRDWGSCVVALQRFHQFLIERDSTQKLCVRFDSIHAPVRHRNHGGDHLVLAALQRQIGRHHRAKRAEGMKHRVRNQRV